MSNTIKRILLLSGGPGVGKSALVKQLAALVPPTQRLGFYTESIFDGVDRRVGFNVCALSGQNAQVAHFESDSSERVGKYGVDVAELEGVFRQVLPIPSNQQGIYFIDELGKLECKSQYFIDVMTTLLEARQFAVVSSPLKGQGLLATYLTHPAVMRVKVTEESAASIFQQASRWLASITETME